MCNEDHPQRVLISIEFGRTQECEGAAPIHVRYTLSKMTPFGRMEKSASVPYPAFSEIGAEVMDARVFRELSEEINREEIDRFVEAGANSAFGLNAYELPLKSNVA
ncbi:hypothetical protein RPALISO_44 [Ruegeria phage RpAliso]|nr:hypothetical protein RPALISO_44 [Ruegeria phage RpAliso]